MVGADVIGIDHLRVRAAIVVVAEERVVDQHAVDAGDGLGGPVRIEGPDVGMQHRAQHLLLRPRGRCEQRRQDDSGDDQSLAEP